MGLIQMALVIGGMIGTVILAIMSTPQLAMGYGGVCAFLFFMSML